MSFSYLVLSYPASILSLIAIDRLFFRYFAVSSCRNVSHCLNFMAECFSFFQPKEDHIMECPLTFLLSPHTLTLSLPPRYQVIWAARMNQDAVVSGLYSVVLWQLDWDKMFWYTLSWNIPVNYQKNKSNMVHGEDVTAYGCELEWRGLFLPKPFMILCFHAYFLAELEQKVIILGAEFQNIYLKINPRTARRN